MFPLLTQVKLFKLLMSLHILDYSLLMVAPEILRETNFGN